MSKTRSHIYAKGYRAGRQATRWEKFKWFFLHKRTKVEDWIMEDKKDTDFWILLFAAMAIALAGVIVMWVSVR